MKTTFLFLVICGLTPAAYSQQTPLDQLTASAPDERFSAMAEPAPAAVKNAPAAENKPAQSFPRREVKFLFGKPAAKSANCAVADQNGTMDSIACRDFPGKIRCYADVRIDVKTFRVWGGCAESYSDCWWSGSAVVQDPCESIEVNPALVAPQQTGCKVKDQSGTMDSQACRDSEDKIRCYAEVEADGSSFKVYGGCFGSYSDCWSTGPGAVNPCD